MAGKRNRKTDICVTALKARPRIVHATLFKPAVRSLPIPACAIGKRIGHLCDRFAVDRLVQLRIHPVRQSG